MRARRQRHVEMEVLGVERRRGALGGHGLREREALDAQQIRCIGPVREDAPVAGAAPVGADEDVGTRRGHGRRAGTLQQDAAAALPDGRGGLRRMHLRAVREVGVGAGLSVRTVAVDDALLRRRRRAVSGRRAGVPAVEDPASHGDDPIAGARPRPRGVGACLPLGVDEAIVVPGGQAVGVDRIEEHEMVDVGAHVRRREVAARVAVHPLDDAVDDDRDGVDDLAVLDGRPLGVHEDEHVEEPGLDAGRIATATELRRREVAVHRGAEGTRRRHHGEHEHGPSQVSSLPAHGALLP